MIAANTAARNMPPMAGWKMAWIKTIKTFSSSAPLRGESLRKVIPRTPIKTAHNRPKNTQKIAMRLALFVSSASLIAIKRVIIWGIPGYPRPQAIREAIAQNPSVLPSGFFNRLRTWGLISLAEVIAVWGPPKADITPMGTPTRLLSSIIPEQICPADG